MMARQQPCLHMLQQAMQSTPASKLSTKCRKDLAMVLDPVKQVPNRDYRFFAEHLGLLPHEWQFLDSQKIPGHTSSTCLVLEHLIEQKGDAFTVWQIYVALHKMNSSGQQVITEFMLQNWKVLGFGTRPGQENTENSFCQCVQCINANPPAPQSPPSLLFNNSFPPPYPGPPGSQQSVVDQHYSTASAFPQNQLQGRYPVEDEYFSNTLQKQMCRNDSLTDQHTESLSAGSHRSSFPQQLPGDDSFPFVQDQRGPLSIQRHPAALQHRASWSPGQGRQSSGNFSPLLGPESFMEWQNQHHPSNNGQGHMTEPNSLNRLRLDFIPPSGYEPDSSGGMTPLYFGWNIPPDDRHFANPSFHGEDNSSIGKSSRVMKEHPVSFPNQIQSSSALGDPSQSHMSQRSLCSHQGACNCSNNRIIFENPHPPNANRPTRNRNSMHTGVEFYLPSDDDKKDAGREKSQKYSTSVAHSWNESHHNPPVKRASSLPPLGQGSQFVQIVHYHIYRDGTSPNHSRPGDRSLDTTLQPSRKPVGQTPSQPDGSDPFVLVLAGDCEQSNASDLAREVFDLAKVLQEHRIPHVIVTSTSTHPIVWLSDAQYKELLQHGEDLSTFVKTCYKKAKKILIAVSPGYLHYADAFLDGSGTCTSYLQKTIRRQHERMKEEHSKSNSYTHRLWPVLLHKLGTERTHIPIFLQRVYFYWFGKTGEENVAVVLETEFQKGHRINE